MPSGDRKDEKARRFEQAMHDLIDEGYSILDYYGLIAAAAKRAGVDLQEAHPTLH